jgi:hypothetical protein
MLKHILLCLLLLPLAACGGGGVDSNASLPPQTNTPVYKTAQVKINISGALPAGSAISGTSFTLYLPANVTPVMTSGAIADGVINISGIFAAGIMTPPVYSPATISSGGSIQLALASSAPAGAPQAGEVANITLQLSSGAAPTAKSIVVSTDGVYDLAGNPLAGMTVVVADVVLQ